MDNQTSTSTPSASTLMSEEKAAECMRRSRNELDWEMRKRHLKFILGDNFNVIWTKVILLSGLAREKTLEFEGHINPHPKKEKVINSTEGLDDLLDRSEKSTRIAPL